MIMKTFFIQSVAFAAFVALTSLLPFSSTGDDLPNITSITMELIPAAHPESPLYDPSLSPNQLLHKAIGASLNTDPPLSPAPGQLPQPPITNSGWDYFVKFSLGTPPNITLLGTIDLATDFTWVQCRTCITGGPHCQGSPYFVPGQSSTYKTEHCKTSANCRPISAGFAICSPKRTCHYSVEYDDGSSTSGVLSTDTITLAGKTIPNFRAYFGCGSYNNGLLGVVGLGEGNASLLGQLQLRKFSYSLVPPMCRTRTGKLTLGGLDVSGVSLPFAQGNKNGAYYVNLQGISVGENKIQIPGGRVAMLVNPRTTLMRLPPLVFTKLENAVRKALNKPRQVRDKTRTFKLCFAGSEEEYNNLRVNISLNFQGGDVKMRTINMFVYWYNAVCLAALPAENGSEAAVYGSFAQINFLVGVDLGPRRAVLVQQLKDQPC